MPYLYYRIINRHSTAISDRVRSVTLVAPLQQHSAHVIFLDELPAGVERMVASRTNTLLIFHCQRSYLIYAPPTLSRRTSTRHSLKPTQYRSHMRRGFPIVADYKT